MYKSVEEIIKELKTYPDGISSAQLGKLKNFEKAGDVCKYIDNTAGTANNAKGTYELFIKNNYAKVQQTIKYDLTRLEELVAGKIYSIWTICSLFNFYNHRSALFLKKDSWSADVSNNVGILINKDVHNNEDSVNEEFNSGDINYSLHNNNGPGDWRYHAQTDNINNIYLFERVKEQKTTKHIVFKGLFSPTKVWKEGNLTLARYIKKSTKEEQLYKLNFDFEQNIKKNINQNNLNNYVDDFLKDKKESAPSSLSTIGKIGEILFYHLNGDKKIEWNSINGKKRANHDFVLEDNFIEIKATTRKNDFFYLSRNEKELFLNSQTKYKLILFKFKYSENLVSDILQGIYPEKLKNPNKQWANKIMNKYNIDMKQISNKTISDNLQVERYFYNK